LSLVLLSMRFLASVSERAASASLRAESASATTHQPSPPSPHQYSITSTTLEQEHALTEVHDSGREGILQVHVLECSEGCSHRVVRAEGLEHRHHLLPPGHQVSSRGLQDVAVEALLCCLDGLVNIKLPVFDLHTSPHITTHHQPPSIICSR
jgi:hypothetical protein